MKNKFFKIDSNLDTNEKNITVNTREPPQPPQPPTPPIQYKLEYKYDESTYFDEYNQLDGNNKYLDNMISNSPFILNDNKLQVNSDNLKPEKFKKPKWPPDLGSDKANATRGPLIDYLNLWNKWNDNYAQKFLGIGTDKEYLKKLEIKFIPFSEKNSSFTSKEEIIQDGEKLLRKVVDKITIDKVQFITINFQNEVGEYVEKFLNDFEEDKIQEEKKNMEQLPDEYLNFKKNDEDLIISEEEKKIIDEILDLSESELDNQSKKYNIDKLKTFLSNEKKKPNSTLKNDKVFITIFNTFVEKKKQMSAIQKRLLGLSDEPVTAEEDINSIYQKFKNKKKTDEWQQFKNDLMKVACEIDILRGVDFLFKFFKKFNENKEIFKIPIKCYESEDIICSSTLSIPSVEVDDLFLNNIIKCESINMSNINIFEGNLKYNISKNDFNKNQCYQYLKIDDFKVEQEQLNKKKPLYNDQLKIENIEYSRKKDITLFNINKLKKEIIMFDNLIKSYKEYRIKLSKQYNILKCIQKKYNDNLYCLYSDKEPTENEESNEYLINIQSKLKQKYSLSQFIKFFQKYNENPQDIFLNLSNDEFYTIFSYINQSLKTRIEVFISKKRKEIFDDSLEGSTTRSNRALRSRARLKKKPPTRKPSKRGGSQIDESNLSHVNPETNIENLFIQNQINVDKFMLYINEDLTLLDSEEKKKKEIDNYIYFEIICNSIILDEDSLFDLINKLNIDRLNKKKLQQVITFLNEKANKLNNELNVENMIMKFPEKYSDMKINFKNFIINNQFLEIIIDKFYQEHNILDKLNLIVSSNDDYLESDDNINNLNKLAESAGVDNEVIEYALNSDTPNLILREMLIDKSYLHDISDLTEINLSEKKIIELLNNFDVDNTHKKFLSKYINIKLDGEKNEEGIEDKNKLTYPNWTYSDKDWNELNDQLQTELLYYGFTKEYWPQLNIDLQIILEKKKLTEKIEFYIEEVPAETGEDEPEEDNTEVEQLRARLDAELAEPHNYFIIEINLEKDMNEFLSEIKILLEKYCEFYQFNEENNSINEEFINIFEIKEEENKISIKQFFKRTDLELHAAAKEKFNNFIKNINKIIDEDLFEYSKTKEVIDSTKPKLSKFKKQKLNHANLHEFQEINNLKKLNIKNIFINKLIQNNFEFKEQEQEQENENYIKQIKKIFKTKDKPGARTEDIDWNKIAQFYSIYFNNNILKITDLQSIKLDLIISRKIIKYEEPNVLTEVQETANNDLKIKYNLLTKYIFIIERLQQEQYQDLFDNNSYNSTQYLSKGLLSNLFYKTKKYINNFNEIDSEFINNVVNFNEIYYEDYYYFFNNIKYFISENYKNLRNLVDENQSDNIQMLISKKGIVVDQQKKQKIQAALQKASAAAVATGRTVTEEIINFKTIKKSESKITKKELDALNFILEEGRKDINQDKGEINLFDNLDEKFYKFSENEEDYYKDLTSYFDFKKDSSESNNFFSKVNNFKSIIKNNPLKVIFKLSNIGIYSDENEARNLEVLERFDKDITKLKEIYKKKMLKVNHLSDGDYDQKEIYNLLYLSKNIIQICNSIIEILKNDKENFKLAKGYLNNCLNILDIFINSGDKCKYYLLELTNDNNEMTTIFNEINDYYSPLLTEKLSKKNSLKCYNCLSTTIPFSITKFLRRTSEEGLDVWNYKQAQMIDNIEEEINAIDITKNIVNNTWLPYGEKQEYNSRFGEELNQYECKNDRNSTSSIDLQQLEDAAVREAADSNVSDRFLKMKTNKNNFFLKNFKGISKDSEFKKEIFCDLDDFNNKFFTQKFDFPFPPNVYNDLNFVKQETSRRQKALPLNAERANPIISIVGLKSLRENDYNEVQQKIIKLDLGNIKELFSNFSEDGEEGKPKWYINKETLKQVNINKLNRGDLESRPEFRKSDYKEFINNYSNQKKNLLELMNIQSFDCISDYQDQMIKYKITEKLKDLYNGKLKLVIYTPIQEEVSDLISYKSKDECDKNMDDDDDILPRRYDFKTINMIVVIEESSKLEQLVNVDNIDFKAVYKEICLIRMFETTKKLYK